MKKLINFKSLLYVSFLIIISVLSAMLLCSCSPSNEDIAETEFRLCYSAGEGGEIEGEVTQNVRINLDGAVVTAVPDIGYAFVQWSDNESTNPVRQDINVNSDITATAIFEKLTYTVKYETDGNGSIEGTATQTVTYGESAVAVKAVPNEGYKFVKWQDNGSTENIRTDLNVTEDITATAIFEKLTYSVKYETDGNGSIEGTATQTVAYSESAVAVKAVPNEGYKFVEWSDGISAFERQDKNITADKTVTAVFEKIVLSVNYSALAGGKIKGDSEQSVEYGKDAVFVIAVPENGYKFVKWSDGNHSPVRRDDRIENPLNLTAEFEFLYSGGEGSSANPFTLTNYTQLNDMWYYPEANYKLLNDLDLSGILHEPIFDEIYYFKGNFNGGGHTVSNLTVETVLNYPSLFGVVVGGIICNLNFDNAIINTVDFNTLRNNQNYGVGIVAGKLSGLIDNIKINGAINVNALSGDGVAIGGLAGISIGTIADCSCNIKINIKNVFSKNSTNMQLPFVFGGLVGVGTSMQIINCNSSGEINITDSYADINNGTASKATDICAGGLIGYYNTIEGSHNSIKDSQTNVIITGDHHYEAGGFIGCLNVNKNTFLQIVNNSVFGDLITGSVGGFILKAYNNGDLLIDNCYVENDITAYSGAAGFIFTCNNEGGSVKINNSRTTGNVSIHRYYDAEIVAGSASGFCASIWHIQLTNCYALRNLKSCHSVGFCGSIYYSHINSCFYIGNITVDGERENGNYHGIGFAMDINNSVIYNCFVNADINYFRAERLTGFAESVNDSEISNFYAVGKCEGALFKYVENSIIKNGHVLRDFTGSDLLDGIDVTVYESAEDMYFLADKLNEGQDEEIWLNMENDFPQLKINIKPQNGLIS